MALGVWGWFCEVWEFVFGPRGFQDPVEPREGAVRAVERSAPPPSASPPPSLRLGRRAYLVTFENPLNSVSRTKIGLPGAGFRPYFIRESLRIGPCDENPALIWPGSPISGPEALLRNIRYSLFSQGTVQKPWGTTVIDDPWRSVARGLPDRPRGWPMRPLCFCTWLYLER